MPDAKKNKGGRPPRILTAEEIEQVEKLAAYLSTDQIADYFGISKKTFYSVMERQKDVSILYKRGKAKLIQKMANTLIQKASEGNITALIFILKTQGGWRETDPDRDPDEQKAQPVNVVVKVEDASKS